MYKVLLVDDEKWIIKGLRHGINWESYSLEVVGEACNGIEAFELIKTLKPDIVITDIQMPGMNGLELIKNSKTISTSTLFIVLSGYAEFSYAQKALTYGVYNYCLKPFELEELEATLERAVKSLENNNSNKNNDTQYINDILFSNNMEKINTILNEANLFISYDNPIVPIVSLGFDEIPIVSSMVHIRFKTSYQRYAYLMSASDLDKVTNYYVNNPLKAGSIGIGFPITDSLMINESLDAATIAAYDVFITGKSGVYNITSISVDNSLAQIFSNLLISMKNKECSQLIYGLEAARNEIHTNHLPIQYAYVLYNIINYMFQSDTKISNLVGDYEKLYLHFNSLDKMIDYLKESIFHMCSYTSSYASTSIEHSTIKEILTYISEHFTEEFSIHDLSDRFFLSANYLSHLFKKEVGENIIEYISRLRIEYACNLLSNTDQQIQEISQECGYNDYCYFAKIFKRYRKMTPTEYRNQTPEADL